MISMDRPARADHLDEQERALNIIDKFATGLCKDIPLVGSGENFELSGKAKADLNGLIKKLADLGIEGTGSYQILNYEGVLQKDLAVVLSKNTDCKMEVFRKLESKLLEKREGNDSTPPAPPSRSSRDIPDFVQVGDTFTTSQGGSGNNQYIQKGDTNNYYYSGPPDKSREVPPQPTPSKGRQRRRSILAPGIPQDPDYRPGGWNGLWTGER